MVLNLHGPWDEGLSGNVIDYSNPRGGAVLSGWRVSSRRGIKIRTCAVALHQHQHFGASLWFVCSFFFLGAKGFLYKLFIVSTHLFYADIDMLDLNMFLLFTHDLQLATMLSSSEYSIHLFKPNSLMMCLLI